MASSWTKFCGEDGSPHDINCIECPNCGAMNPRARQTAGPDLSRLKRELEVNVAAYKKCCSCSWKPSAGPQKKKQEPQEPHRDRPDDSDDGH
jgi:hypothetical protein